MGHRSFRVKVPTRFRFLSPWSTTAGTVGSRSNRPSETEPAVPKESLIRVEEELRAAQKVVKEIDHTTMALPSGRQDTRRERVIWAKSRSASVFRGTSDGPEDSQSQRVRELLRLSLSRRWQTASAETGRSTIGLQATHRTLQRTTTIQAKIITHISRKLTPKPFL